MNDVARRKDAHVDVVLAGGVDAAATVTGFDDVRFEHVALPELALDEVDVSVDVLGRRRRTPLLVSAMTGGPSRSAAINAAIAEACEAVGATMAVGSQRVALTGGPTGGIDENLRRLAPTTPIWANLGAVQLVAGLGPDDAKRAVEAIDAEVLVLHLNPVQEALQADGDVDWRGVAAAIEATCAAVDVPVVAKEVGFGISARVARRLVDLGVAGIDVAGAGGTSWAAVEGRVAGGATRQARLGEVFRDWGVPTAAALVEVRAALPDVPLVASGGIRHGLDVARAIRLGADLVGQAGPVLHAAVDGTAAVVEHLETVRDALRLACFATGSRDLAALGTAPLLHPLTRSGA